MGQGWTPLETLAILLPCMLVHAAVWNAIHPPMHGLPPVTADAGAEATKRLAAFYAKDVDDKGRLVHTAWQIDPEWKAQTSSAVPRPPGSPRNLPSMGIRSARIAPREPRKEPWQPAWEVEKDKDRDKRG